ncbi:MULTISPECIES: hypothetical protein [unclassified Janthinobacterium]|uniref:hypothetical protein n=1 Tax=unclassified Janthinobacterium TaxID=2610881 RepID=UPI0003498C8F|nr:MULTISPECIES: hypothetical protein [unclassified Janthinobacterium]MEC5161721.1 hypothetical protein [Janthinobacterium sp. CG_S6]
MSQRTLAKSFAAGELTPELFGRIDLSKLQAGLAICRNFKVLPHGPVESRAGFEFVREVKNSAVATRLIPFTYSVTQTMAIEVGAGYFRFHSNGATLLSAGVPYEVANPYAAADLLDIHYVQSADVLTLVHPNYSVQELRRLGALSWTLTAPTFQAPVNVPTGVTAVPTLAGATPYQYVVTAVNTANLEETVASGASAVITNDLTISGHYNTISWAAPAGTIARYNVYKLANGLYGFIGQAASLSFVDNNITPDVARTPPINDTGFNDAAGNYPGAVSYFEQRRCFAGTNNLPQNFWATKSGTESNMSYSIPTRDDNRVAFRIAAREASAIRHIVPAASLILLTPSCEWRVNPAGDVLTPSSVQVRPQSYIGCNNVTPALVGNSVLFAQARGGRIREMSYSWQANGYQANDISILAPHLFDYNNIIDMAFSRAPTPVLWCVSSNGNLLGMTYVPEQQVAAWHRHDTINGAFEAVCTITETPAGQVASEEMLYAVVRRTIGGVTKRYVERMHTRYFATPADAFFVDCGATYTGAAATTISGLTWLEGQTVSILADGAVQPQRVVTGGAVTLQNAASKVQVGLPITADLQTLPLALQIDAAAGVGKPKNVNKVWLRVQRSSGIFAGPTFDTLIEVKERTNEPWGTPPALKSGEVSVMVSPSWGPDGAICVRQSDPLPLTVVSIALEVATGG